MTRPSIRWLGSGLAAVLIAGCALGQPAGIQVTLPAVDPWDPLPVTVVDNAGIVAGAAPADGSFTNEDTDERAVEIGMLPGRDDAIQVDWTGGACDDRATVTIDPEGDTFRIATHTMQDLTALSCPAVGIPRSLVLTLTGPMDADAFVSF